MSFGLRIIAKHDCLLSLMRFRVLILYFLFFSTSLSAWSSPYLDYNERCKNAYELIFKLRFNQALDSLDAERKEHPDNLIPGYLYHYHLFIKTFIGEEQGVFNELKHNHEIITGKIKAMPVVSPLRNFCLAECYLMTALSKLKFKEYLTAALQVKKAYGLLTENQKKFPEFELNLKSLGVLHAFIGAVPENYQWLVKIAGMDGSVSNGIKELEQSYMLTREESDDFHFMNKEIAFTYVFTRNQLKPDPEWVLKFLSGMTLENEPLDLFFSTNIYYTTGQSAKIIPLLEMYHPSDEVYPIHYFQFLLGMSKLNKLDYSAFTYFNNYVKLHKGNSFVKAAYQKMAWIKLLQNDKVGYDSLITEVKNVGNDFTDEDKQAQSELVTQQVPNVYLLKIRLLFDGGYYQEALKLLAKGSIEAKTAKDQLEYKYRLARVLDKLEMNEQAKEFYLKTINHGQNLKLYYAAASCNFLAQMYEKEKNMVMAEKYYKKCLSLRDHEYQNSLDQKAKAGLNRIAGGR